MTDYKRNISEVVSSSSHDDKKLHTKPGRKPIEIEPKSKRTAQNRAAQRAYRERKERKMQDLEDKVKSLEDENIKATTESDFLKAQVDMLKNELARYRGHGDFSDLKLPTTVGHLSNPRTRGTYRPPIREKESSNSVNSHSDSASNKSSLSEPKYQSNDSSSNTSPESNNNYSASFPWSKDAFGDKNKYQYSQKHVPDLISGSSSSTSPLNDNILVSPESQNSVPNTVNNNQFETGTESNYGLTHETFDEQVDPFCVKLNEACGNKQHPIPKDKENQFQYSSPFSNLKTHDNDHYKNTSNTYENIGFDPFFNGDSKFNFELSGNDNEDPLSFLNDNNFDVSLAFADTFTQPKKDNEVDPMSLLTTEESAYDPLSDKGFDFNDYVRGSVSNSIPEGNENEVVDRAHSKKNNAVASKSEESEVVPAPEETIRCSEIWDRIASHPKYTELDIDGLCSELKSKAKCSETGVVINSADVNQLLEQSAIFKHK